jgi:hypothetical protein
MNMKIENVRIRPNIDETNRELFGWGECLLPEQGLFINNIKIRLKKREGTEGIRVTLDFPSKLVTLSDKSQKKIFYVKPVNATAYRAFEQAFITAIRVELGRKHGS